MGDIPVASLSIELDGLFESENNSPMLYLGMTDMNLMMLRGCMFIDGFYHQIAVDEYDACYDAIDEACTLKGQPVNALREGMFDVCRKDDSPGGEYTLILVVGKDELQEGLDEGDLRPGDDYPAKSGYILDEACDAEYSGDCPGLPGDPYPNRPGFFYDEFCDPVCLAGEPGEPYPDKPGFIYDELCQPVCPGGLLPGYPNPEMVGYVNGGSCQPVPSSQVCICLLPKTPNANKHAAWVSYCNARRGRTCLLQQDCSLTNGFFLFKD